MYDDEDEEYLEEEDEILDEIEDRRAQNDTNMRTSSKVTNGIKGKVGEAAKGAAKKAAKAAAGAIKAGLKKLAIFLISHPVILIALLVIIALAIIYFAITNALSNSVTNGVNDYIKGISETMDEASKEAYEKNGSLLLLKVSDINEMYNAYMKSDTVGNDLKSVMKTVLGITDVQGSAKYENKKAFSPQDVLSTAKTLTKKFADEGYVYGVPAYVPAASNGNTGGSATTSGGTVLGSTAKCISSNGFISWILSELGLKNQPVSGLKIGYDYAEDSKGLAWFCEKNNFKKITDINLLENGDIVLLVEKERDFVAHTYIFDGWTNKSEGECKAYDCGSKTWIQSGNQPITRTFESRDLKFLCAYRPEVK